MAAIAGLSLLSIAISATKFTTFTVFNNSTLLYVCCNHYRDQHSLVDKFDKKYPVEKMWFSYDKLKCFFFLSLALNQSEITFPLSSSQVPQPNCFFMAVGEPA